MASDVAAGTAAPATAPPAPRALHVALWIVQALLALAFLFFGGMKLAHAPAMAKMLGMPAGMVYFIGTSEVTGALGLLLPSLSRVAPWLTPLAAVGLATVMVLAVRFHLLHAQASHVPLPAALGALALFIAWGRFRAAPIAART